MTVERVRYVIAFIAIQKHYEQKQKPLMDIDNGKNKRQSKKSLR